MTREEKCLLAIEKGITYDPTSGKVYGIRGKEITQKSDGGYLKIDLYINKEKHTYIYLHLFAWYYINKEIVEELDHINGIRDDNRIENLRSVTKQQNQWNRLTAKGYYWNKTSNKWKAQIKINGEVIYLGLFNTEDEARQAYLNAKEKYHKIGPN